MSQPLVLSGVDVEGIDPLLAGDHLEEKVMSLFTTPQRCLRTYSRRRRFSAWLLVLLRTGPTALESRNHSYIVLTWLKYGVKARRKTYALHNQFLDIHVFVNGDDEETDLSGMLMIETDRLLILERAVMRAVQKRLDDLGNQVPNLLRDDLDIHSRHDRHSKIPSFDGKDFDQVSVMDVFTAPSSEVFLNGLPFLFSSVGYHFREVKAQVEEVLECKEVLTDTWSERLIQDFHALQNTILENFVREPN